MPYISGYESTEVGQAEPEAIVKYLEDGLSVLVKGYLQGRRDLITVEMDVREQHVRFEGENYEKPIIETKRFSSSQIFVEGQPATFAFRTSGPTPETIYMILTVYQVDSTAQASTEANRQYKKNYYIGDLLGENERRVSGKAIKQAEDLVRYITQTIEPASWSSAGGEGVIAVLEDIQLVIKSTAGVHGQIRGFLQQLRPPPSGGIPYSSVNGGQ